MTGNSTTTDLERLRPKAPGHRQQPDAISAAMSWGGLTIQALRRVGVSLAALALVVRLLIPAGYMLSAQPAANGLPNLVICTGHGEMVVALNADGKPSPAGQPKPDDGKRKSSDHPCTFASASVGHAGPILVALRKPNLTASVQSPPLLKTQYPGLGLAAPPPPACGPPQASI